MNLSPLADLHNTHDWPFNTRLFEGSLLRHEVHELASVCEGWGDVPPTPAAVNAALTRLRADRAQVADRAAADQGRRRCRAEFDVLRARWDLEARTTPTRRTP